LSVSQPLAANDDHAGAESDPQKTGRRDPETSDKRRIERSRSSSGSKSGLLEQLISAPEHLGLESRIEFREAASALIDRIPTGRGRLAIDCGCLKSIDSSGLNALILVQRKAARRRVQVVLRALDEELLALLVLTKLDDLFELADGLAR
jgi:anti-anti-sigma factor